MPDEIAEMLKDPALTNMQRRFILAYLKHLNGSKAARVAGYSVKCAHQQAYENMRKPKIRRIIDKGLELKYYIWAVDPAVIDNVGGREPDR
jgi:phage terminase small subunit